MHSILSVLNFLYVNSCFCFCLFFFFFFGGYGFGVWVVERRELRSLAVVWAQWLLFTVLLWPWVRNVAIWEFVQIHVIWELCQMPPEMLNIWELIWLLQYHTQILADNLKRANKKWEQNTEFSCFVVCIHHYYVQAKLIELRSVWI